MIQFVSETGSTSHDLAARLSVGEHVREGEWLVTDRQTAGRGRSGRQWLDGSGNFMGSTIVHPSFGDPPPATLALVAGLAVLASIAVYLPDEVDARLKWPNDVMIGSAKLAGVLLERAGDAVIVGVGVNLAQSPQVAGRDTTAVARFGPVPRRDAFAERLAVQFDLEMQRWREFGLAPIVRRWQAAAHPPGTALLVGSPDGTVSGTFAGLDDEGALQLRLADGAVRVIHAGEVRLADADRG